MAERLSSAFIRALRVRAARVSTGASATRGQGRGVSRAARQFLSDLNLRYFATSRPSLFAARLDIATKALASSLPRGSRNWGIARKLLNIFLREALYTSYLARYSGVAKAERLMELPLDSITAGRLIGIAERGQLPRWRGVKHVTEEESARYQALAWEVARGRGIARVHLDTYWWGQRDA